ncbi:MAG: ImmA/IrrE family metallo-endopeptidase [Acidimicrobiales bacterium]
MSSIIGELRDMLPIRRLTMVEALRIAQRQADTLRELAGVEFPHFPEAVIKDLPTVEVEQVHDCPASGATRRVKKRWVILLNASEPLVSQRFSLAHEFKHVLDGGLAQILYPSTDGMTSVERSEQVCDYFASCLLMPDHWVKELWRQETRWLHHRLARRFRVSRQAVEQRLIQVGLADHDERRRISPALQEAIFDEHDSVAS